MPTISFCTAVKGRLHHLQQMLPRSLEATRDMDNVEFAILAYGDRDVERWLLETYPDDIRNGRIRLGYIEAEAFHMAHAKNVSHRLATGDIVCNIDADNEVTRDFARYLTSKFAQPGQDGKFIKYIWQPAPAGEEDVSGAETGMSRRGIAGRIALSKKMFFTVRGYREGFEGWGFDDTDMADRLKNAGMVQIDIPYSCLGETIRHTDAERLEHLPESAKAESARRLAETLDGNFRYVGNLDTANGDGRFGCGEVYINGADEPTLFGPCKLTASGLSLPQKSVNTR